MDAMSVENFSAVGLVPVAGDLVLTFDEPDPRV